jgi:hypothetical protein
MGSKGYAVFGWLVWQVAARLAKRRLAQSNKVKLGAAATVALVLVAGLAAAKAARGED